MIDKLLHARTGPLTDRLVQQPGGLNLGMLPKRLLPEKTTSMVCGFCSTGCSLDVHLREGKAANLSATTNYPVNLGMACPKGWEALTPLAAPDRATTPLVRNDSGELVACTWDDALATFVGKMKSVIHEHGGGAAAWLGTGQMPSEELALLGALARFGMGMHHGDGNTRQCMATAASAYKECFGFDAPPFTYADFEESDVLVFVGSNPCIAHPIMWQRVMRNPHNPDVLVIDPRVTETATAATEHYPIKPKSDLVLLYGLANLLIRIGAVDQDFLGQHTRGFADFERVVAEFPLLAVSEATGLGCDAIEDLAARIARGKRVSFWWTMGVNQGHQATRTAQAIIALALMTGNIGRPGTGANSITGQCNAMGSRLFSNTASMFGGLDFANADHRHEVAEILGIDVARIQNFQGLAYDQIIEAIDAGQIKALWIVATNPAHSWTRSQRFAEVVKKLDFLVVQDMYASTETAQLADLVLPAAGWGEKEGTFINSERRIGVIKKVAKAPGAAMSDFRIFQLIADAWGCCEMFAEWDSPEAVFRIMQRLSTGRPCDITGIDGFDMLEREGGVQWPLPFGQKVDCAERRLFEDGQFFTSDGRAAFIAEKPVDLPEPVDVEFPILLLTGRGSSSQWHTGTRTEKSDVLRKMHPSRVYVEMHPEDARELGASVSGRVSIHSRRGSMEADVFLTETIQRGQVFLPMHFKEVNALTLEVFDPVSRQPGYKACAVQVAVV